MSNMISENNLIKYTIVELKSKCKELNISGYSKMKKEDLIKKILDKYGNNQDLIIENIDEISINSDSKNQELNDDISIVSNSKKINKKKKDLKKDIIDLSYLRLPDNEIIFELKEDDNNDKTESKKKIIKMIDVAHNLLYNEENIEGEDALNDIMNFMFLKSIQPIISDKKEEGKIDLLNKIYYKELYDDDVLTDILSYFDLNSLAKRELKLIRDFKESNDAIRQMGDILKNHPITGQIFTENNFIKAKKATTIQSLLNNVINKINIKELEQNEDVIGEIYEHIINDYVKKGSKLGQFFTPRNLMKLTLLYKKSRILEIIKNLPENEKIRLNDTCMGTGGWLVTGYNMLRDDYEDRLLLSGGEIKQSTFQYGLMNLILTLKKFPDDVQCESSLSHINDIKHHLVLTNPPFQTDKKFENIKQNFNDDKFNKDNNISLDDVYHLKDNNPPIQFLEVDLYKLKENGMCIIVLPYGELFFGSSYAKDRIYFMKETNVTDIILFEGGTFTHTGIKTCALIFEKNKKGTKEINFLQANKKCDVLTRITSVKYEDIMKEPNSSWYLRDYLKDEYIENLSLKMINLEWVEFGDIFTLEKGKTQSSKVEEDENGEGVFINWSLYNKYKKINKCTLDGENLFISTVMPNGKNGGYMVIKYYNGKCDYGDLMSKLIINEKYNDKINLKYMYYYLISIKEHIENTYEKGPCNKSLDQKNFNRMKIPIPVLEEQEQIIQNIMKLEESRKDLLKGIESNHNMRLKYMEAMIKGATNKSINQFKKIGEVCNFENGKALISNNFIDGEYPVVGSGKTPIGYHNEYNMEENTIICASSGSAGLISKYKTKIWASDCFGIKSNNISILKEKYLYNYLLLIQESIFKYTKGCGQVHMDSNILSKFNIPIPPMNYQNQMEEMINKFDAMNKFFNDMLYEIEDGIKTSFLNSLDDYGNPNGFNIYKIIDIDSNESNAETQIV